MADNQYRYDTRDENGEWVRFETGNAKNMVDENE